jgi:hypothetical protein
MVGDEGPYFKVLPEGFVEGYDGITLAFLTRFRTMIPISIATSHTVGAASARVPVIFLVVNLKQSP